MRWLGPLFCHCFSGRLAARRQFDKPKSPRARETQPAAHLPSLFSDLSEIFVPAALRAELRLIPVLPDEAEPPATIGASFRHGAQLEVRAGWSSLSPVSKGEPETKFWPSRRPRRCDGHHR